MPRKFAAQVRDQVRMVEDRARATFQQAALQVINEAQRPRARGGRMRVDTGFLRNSGRAGINGMPKGQIRGEDGKAYNWEGDAQADVILTILGAELGDQIFFGWTAAYARRREIEDGFLGGAAERWQAIVSEKAREAEARIR